MSAYLFLKSSDCLDLFPNNKAYDFHIHLKQSLQLEGIWNVALLELEVDSWISKHKRNEIYVYCNICSDSLVSNRTAPILRRVYFPAKKLPYYSEFSLPLYIPVNLGNTQLIHIYITDEDGDEASFLNGKLSMTLHFKKYIF